jgi:hypothetical protein
VCTGDSEVVYGASGAYAAGDLGVSLDVDAGETVVCTFTNTKQGKVQVVKQQSGTTPPSDATFTFELREGATADTISNLPPPADAVIPGDSGDLLETMTASSLNSFTLDFVTYLVPDETYQICEVTPAAGWEIDFVGVDDTLEFNLTIGGENIRVCIDFTVQAGETKTITVNNVPPPAGDARTIGYWKNWTSCDGNGNQDPILDETLLISPDPFDLDTAAGIIIGTANIDTCAEAVDILDKRDIKDPAKVGDGKKMASNAAYNFAAQLLAYRLNLLAGAGDLPCAHQAALDGQALLELVGFDGIGGVTVSKARAALFNQYARTLDLYNNNILVCS